MISMCVYPPLMVCLAEHAAVAGAEVLDCVHPSHCLALALTKQPPLEVINRGHAQCPVFIVQLTFSTKLVVGSELSAAAVI